MNVVLLTREYPPEVYGGAGVHVAHLARELARRTTVEIRCFGRARPPRKAGPAVRAFLPWSAVEGDATLGVLSVDVAMAARFDGADVVHSHTWYTSFAGHLAKLLHGLPHVATTHSLEPLRPWKAEQLGAGGYAVSSFCERTALESADAVIAVSAAMRDDVLSCYSQVDPARVTVVYNGVDPDEFRPDPQDELLAPLGVDPARPLVVFVGRISRQKGIEHLLRAAPALDPDAQLVLCAGSPDTPELDREVRALAEGVKASRALVWIERTLDQLQLVQLLSHAAVFVCPSVYEPLGIVNLEAMACEAAVVASATGGIVEVVADGETGFLVPLEQAPGQIDPIDPDGFATAFADKVNALIADPELAHVMGQAGRRRVMEHFAWPAIADQTREVYRRVTAGAGAYAPPNVT